MQILLYNDIIPLHVFNMSSFHLADVQMTPSQESVTVATVAPHLVLLYS